MGQPSTSSSSRSMNWRTTLASLIWRRSSGVNRSKSAISAWRLWRASGSVGIVFHLRNGYREHSNTPGYIGHSNRRYSSFPGSLSSAALARDLRRQRIEALLQRDRDGGTALLRVYEGLVLAGVQPGELLGVKAVYD